MKLLGKPFSRRVFLGFLGCSPIGCLPKSEESNERTNTETPPPSTDEEKTPGTDEQTEVSDPDFNPTTPVEDACPPPGVVDLSNLPEVPEALKPTVKAYGPAASALVVIGLQKYTHGRLETIVLTRSDGRTLFRREISPSDITEEDFIHPFLFEGINLQVTDTSSNALTMVVKHNNPGGQEFYKSELGAISVETLNLGKIPVKTLETQTFLAEQSAHHRQGRFYPKNAALHNLTTDRFSELIKEASFSQIEASGIPYPFVVARGDSSYQPASELDNCVITDLLGNPLSTPGAFRDVIGHPYFISEKTIGSVIYRTLVRTN